DCAFRCSGSGAAELFYRPYADGFEFLARRNRNDSVRNTYCVSGDHVWTLRLVRRCPRDHGLSDVRHSALPVATCRNQVTKSPIYSLLTSESLMKTKEIIERARGFAKPFRISKGRDFRLKDVDPNDTLDFTKEADKPRAKEALAMGVTALAELQDKLYAQDKWAVLLIFQAMDAAGKDGAIKHVLSGVNPQGCQVYSFKSPSSDDLDHD